MQVLCELLTALLLDLFAVCCKVFADYLASAIPVCRVVCLPAVAIDREVWRGVLALDTSLPIDLDDVQDTSLARRLALRSKQGPDERVEEVRKAADGGPVIIVRHTIIA